MDEWVGLGANDKGSCRQVMDDFFYTPAKIPRERIHVFNGLADPIAECGAMNKWLIKHGSRLGLALLGVGMNGHVGFNEPNAPESYGAVFVPLDYVTKSVSVKYFGRYRPITHGVTLSLPTLSTARELLVIASGTKKASVIKDAFSGAKTPSNPASMLQDHPRLVLMLDGEAAGKTAS